MTDEQNPENLKSNQDLVDEPQSPTPQAPVTAPATPAAQPPTIQQYQPAIPSWVKARTTNCSYPGCTNTIDPVAALADKETGVKYCSAHVKECFECNEHHIFDDMIPIKSREGYSNYTYWYCPDCYDSKFIECPNCREVTEKDHILPPTRKNIHSMKRGGCNKCAVECYSCDRVVDKEQSYNTNGNNYCEDCEAQLFTCCEKCSTTLDREDAIIQNNAEYCSRCYRKIFVQCKDCEEVIEKSDAEEVNDDYYCSTCAEKHGPLAYVQYTENFSDFTYTKKDRLINPLYKLLPISIKELKSNYKELAGGLGDLIKFSNGKDLTADLVTKYRESLKPEEFPVGYTAWDGAQRSIDTLSEKPTANAQLAINILASPEMLGRLKANPVLYDLFDRVNTISDKSTHPYIKDQIGWIRVELDPKGEFVLVDEVQCDHSNAGYQLKSAQDHSKVLGIKKLLKEKYNTDDLGVNALLINKDLQEDDGVKALRAVYKRKYQRTDAELNAVLADKLVKGAIQERLMSHAANARELAQILLGTLRPTPHLDMTQASIDDDIKSLREIYKRQGKLDDKQLDTLLSQSIFPPELELQEADEDLDTVRNGLKEKYDLDDEGLNNLLAEYTSMVSDFPNIATQAISKFARNNGFKKIFWHTYESGMALKNNEPPRSLYEKTPKDNFFRPSENKPFGLEGQFFEKEARNAHQLYKIARKLYVKYLSLIS